MAQDTSAFVLNPEVNPVQHTPRRIPIALHDKVKAKIAELKRKGIIRKVTPPTEWISSIIIVAKPNVKITNMSRHPRSESGNSAPQVTNAHTRRNTSQVSRNEGF